ncbi:MULTISPECIES: GH1 family beta-glucosidase [Streptomyces]|uniref:Beta-glucosidase n=1 Tax=Streptomyces venezuelae (strain ATCC 10712 / CBS 650.69 / DSM 40230 / JCM 4526 / NBRC 13096 / PD 04745) TaxID=953739 RepID=F2RLS6_STRVP|nr:GH1 family beta-glucosidase [Streptomyces venezuelae]APE25775.1 beta-glucosidase [Streptomyces venezuelae]QES03110.1 beta-glucosidase [Streptomyces venezuelae ATCC 10712]CCA60456.1 Beta-glucosidase [Streptomyces venezuelae ATCC 10712]
MTAPVPEFPADFLWGVSASAFQIEGSLTADGRGPSSWDAFTGEPGRVKDGSHAGVATDHYRRYREDVALMAGLGVGAYRFSVSWSRVLPDGHGRVNEKGLDFYDRLVDELCASGIAPAPTLFHWDTPLALEKNGGWLDRDTAERFAAYASVVAERLADRVPLWITINEPAEVTLLGYGLGEHAPGRRLVFDALPAAHHQLLAHGLGVQALRAAGARQIGIAASHSPIWTAGDTDEDRSAAELYDLLTNRLFADPVLTGAYPDEGLASLLPGPVAEDLKTISAPLDWYGVNYYNPMLVGAPRPAAGGSSFGGIEIPSDLPFAVRQIEGPERTDFGWPVVPDGMRELLAGLRERYGDRLPPLYITENGCSYDDGPDPETGRVDDTRRIAYHDGHVRALHRAMAEGADVRGYFIWSILDNFEWAEGYRQRFGLVHVDYETLARTPKASYAWYRDLIKSGR